MTEFLAFLWKCDGAMALRHDNRMIEHTAKNETSSFYPKNQSATNGPLVFKWALQYPLLPKTVGLGPILSTQKTKPNGGGD